MGCPFRALPRCWEPWALYPQYLCNASEGQPGGGQGPEDAGPRQNRAEEERKSRGTKIHRHQRCNASAGASFETAWVVPSTVNGENNGNPRICRAFLVFVRRTQKRDCGVRAAMGDSDYDGVNRALFCSDWTITAVGRKSIIFAGLSRGRVGARPASDCRHGKWRGASCAARLDWRLCRHG